MHHFNFISKSARASTFCWISNCNVHRLRFVVHTLRTRNPYKIWLRRRCTSHEVRYVSRANFLFLRAHSSELKSRSLSLCKLLTPLRSASLFRMSCSVDSTCGCCILFFLCARRRSMCSCGPRVCRNDEAGKDTRPAGSSSSSSSFCESDIVVEKSEQT